MPGLDLTAFLIPKLIDRLPPCPRGHLAPAPDQSSYRIERKLRRAKNDPQLRAAIRAHQAKPVYARLHPTLNRFKIKRRYLHRSGKGMAIAYALHLWPQLGVYLDDGRVEIDQNLVENAIRPMALGKKNWLFMGDVGAGQRSAILYLIVECCRRRGLNPYAYVRDVLTRLPHATNRQIDQFTSQAWANQARRLNRSGRVARPLMFRLYHRKRPAGCHLMDGTCGSV